MKKILFSIALFITGCVYAFGQITPPVTSGLIQHLDASIGFVPGNPPNQYPFSAPCSSYVFAPYTYAYWADQSGYNNHVQTPPMQTWCGCGVGCTVSGINTNANPTFVNVAYATSYRSYSAVRFDWNDFMETIPGAHHPAGPSGLSAANGLATTDNVTESTIFVVRTQGSPTVQQVAGNDDTHCFVSLSSSDMADFPGMTIPQGGLPGRIRDEFCLMRNWGAHITMLNHGPITWGYNYITYKDHQCFDSTPSNKPVVLSASFGTNFGDLEYYVNGIQSTNSLQDPSSKISTNHTAADRLITIGSRRCNYLYGIDWDEYARADIFEVLVYNRKLSSTEMDQVNDWLKCKYDLQYTACNVFPKDCPRNCWLSPQLNINFTKKNTSGQCEFDATVTANTQPGVTNYGFEWTFPGSAPFIVVSAATTDMQSFTMNPSNGQVKVRILGINTGETPDLGCCDFSITANVYCSDLDGGVYQKPTTTGNFDKEARKISIYPNPTDRDLFIKFADDGEHTISVIDFMGKEVRHMTTLEKLNKIPFEGLAVGAYMVQIKDKDGKLVESKKVIFKQ